MVRRRPLRCRATSNRPLVPLRASGQDAVPERQLPDVVRHEEEPRRLPPFRVSRTSDCVHAFLLGTARASGFSCVACHTQKSNDAASDGMRGGWVAGGSGELGRMRPGRSFA